MTLWKISLRQFLRLAWLNLSDKPDASLINVLHFYILTQIYFHIFSLCTMKYLLIKTTKSWVLWVTIRPPAIIENTRTCRNCMKCLWFSSYYYIIKLNVCHAEGNILNACTPSFAWWSLLQPCHTTRTWTNWGYYPEPALIYGENANDHYRQHIRPNAEIHKANMASNPLTCMVNLVPVGGVPWELKFANYI